MLIYLLEKLYFTWADLLVQQCLVCSWAVMITDLSIMYGCSIGMATILILDSELEVTVWNSCTYS